MNVPITNRQSYVLDKLVKDVKIRDFIEIGCGEGDNLKVLHKIGFKGLGIDLSEDALKLARAKNLENIDIIKGNFLNLQLKKKIGLIIFLFVLEHIKDDAKALRKINSLIMGGGYLILSAPAHSNLYSIQDKLAGHYRRYDMQEIRSKLNVAGFEVDKIISIGFPISNFYTHIYNVCMSFKVKDCKFMQKNTRYMGVNTYKDHFPISFRLLSRIAFPVLGLLLRLDKLFWDTDLGTHYIILAKKVNDIPD